MSDNRLQPAGDSGESSFELVEVARFEAWLKDAAASETGTNSLFGMTAEEEMLAACSGELPVLRPGLRRELLLELHGLKHRRHQRRNSMVMAVVTLITVVGLMSLPPGHGPMIVVASNDARRPAPLPDLDSPWIPAEIRAACSEPNSWALVDAYSQVRARHRSTLQGMPSVSADSVAEARQ